MLPSADGSPLSGGSDDRTRFVPRAAAHLDDRTTIVPMVRRPSRLRTLLPWAGFGVVAVVVVAATSAWASTLRGSDDPLLANATPPPVVVSQIAAPAGASVNATPVDETPVPVATTRKRLAPVAPVVPPPAPAPAPVVATTTVKPTSAAPTSAKPTKSPAKTPENIKNTDAPCLLCAPTAAGNAPPATAAN